MAFYDDEEQMRAELLRFVPVGTPVDEARRTMQRAGFECSTAVDDRLGPYLYCQASRRWKWPVYRHWSIKLSYDERGVTDAKVTTGLVGP